MIAKLAKLQNDNPTVLDEKLKLHIVKKPKHPDKQIYLKLSPFRCSKIRWPRRKRII